MAWRAVDGASGGVSPPIRATPRAYNRRWEHFFKKRRSDDDVMDFACDLNRKYDLDARFCAGR